MRNRKHDFGALQRSRSPRPFILACFLALVACKPGTSVDADKNSGSSQASIPRSTYRVEQVIPHDEEAFTQGLLLHQGRMFESSGLYGRSNIRETEPYTGEVLRQQALPSDLFAEGLAFHRGVLVLLTWRAGVGIVFDPHDFREVRRFRYQGEGWGLTSDGNHLIMSDGTAELKFLDPSTYDVVRTVTVRAGDRPTAYLNELEYVKGEIWANVYQTKTIARIAPDTGQVVGWIDLSGLPRPEERTGREDVLNGIAYDADSDKLFVTGKHFAYMYQIALKEIDR